MTRTQRPKTPAPVDDTVWTIPDNLWPTLEEILLELYPAPATGRPRADLRRVLDGILFRLRSGVQWNRLPAEFGSDSTVHRWFQRFVSDGVFERLWAVLVGACDELGGVEWDWQSADTASGKARFGGDLVGPNPTDRAKPGTKRGVLTDGAGRPLGAMVAPANRHDSKLIEGIIESVVVERPDRKKVEQHLCLDKGFDTADSEAAVEAAGYTPHIRRIGEETEPLDPKTGHKPRRWVVERLISWLNKCRALLVRYDKKAENYLGMIQYACAILWWRRLCKITNEPVLG